MSPSAYDVSLRLRCIPPLAEGQSGRLGRRLYSQLTMRRQTTPNGLSARVPRDSPEERNSMSPSVRMTSNSPEERNIMRPSNDYFKISRLRST